MDLTEFSGPIASGNQTNPQPWAPKPWLNINANSVHVGPGGGGASTTAYSQFANVSASNYTGQRSISANAAHSGSLTIPPLPIGAVIRMRANIGLNLQTSGCTPRLMLNGAEISRVSFSSPTVLSGQASFDAEITILPSSLCKPTFYINPTDLGLASDDPSVTGTPAFNNAASNTLDFTIDFSVANANNNFSCTQFYVELLNAN